MGLQLGTGEIVAVDARGKSEVMLTVPAALPYSIDWLPAPAPSC